MRDDEKEKREEEHQQMNTYQIEIWFDIISSVTRDGHGRAPGKINLNNFH